MAEKGKKVICDSFRSHCWCRIALLACQTVIILAVFLFYGLSAGRKLPYDEKIIFLFWVGILTGFSVMALEVFWCRKCLFFRSKVESYRAAGFVLILKIQHRLFYLFN